MFETQDPYIKSVVQYLKDLGATYNSNTICSAKWLQGTTLLYNGTTHSCHHNPRHKIDYYAVQKDYTLIFNTPQKIKEREQMKAGVRPAGCEYCWKFEDQGDLSDRYYKTGAYQWSRKNIERLKTNTPVPAYLEVAFDSTCNFKCMYCSPESSSKWMEEIKRFGKYDTSDGFNNLEELVQEKRIPITQREYNPYNEAFWKWWPELNRQLKVLRLTGGEPLMSRHVWEVMDKVIEHPNAEMVLGVNTNLGVPQKLISNFIEKLKIIETKLEKTEVYTSCEAHGKYAEFIRFGLNYQEFLDNSYKVLSNTQKVTLTFMMTNNALSIFSVVDFIKDVQKLQAEFPNRVIFDPALLSYPSFLAINVIEKALSIPALTNFVEHIKKTGTEIELNKVSRLLHAAATIPPHLEVLKRDFGIYFSQYDERRGTDFKALFPELYYLIDEVKKHPNERPRIRAHRTKGAPHV